MPQGICHRAGQFGPFADRLGQCQSKYYRLLCDVYGATGNDISPGLCLFGARATLDLQANAGIE
jgi:hypothetical protein